MWSEIGNARRPNAALAPAKILGGRGVYRPKPICISVCVALRLLAGDTGRHGDLEPSGKRMRG
jgi:hypothetical protein